MPPEELAATNPALSYRPLLDFVNISTPLTPQMVSSNVFGLSVLLFSILTFGGLADELQCNLGVDYYYGVCANKHGKPALVNGYHTYEHVYGGKFMFSILLPIFTACLILFTSPCLLRPTFKKTSCQGRARESPRFLVVLYEV